ncbi:MAG: TauD/TfdA family dioxygenase, partial [Proteobacteria bacterium]
HSKVDYVSNIDRGGRFRDRNPDPHSAFWHSDGSWAKTPPKATLLYADQAPKSGGETRFIDTFSLYDRLPPRLQKQLRGLYAIHDLELSRAYRRRQWPCQRRPGKSISESLLLNLSWLAAQHHRLRSTGFVYHRIVRPHPETGRRAIFLGDHAWAVKSRFLPFGVYRMIRLKRAIYSRALQYTHIWRPGDLLVWDNRCVLHRAGNAGVGSHARVLRRCVVLGQ